MSAALPGTPGQRGKAGRSCVRRYVPGHAGCTGGADEL